MNRRRTLLGADPQRAWRLAAVAGFGGAVVNAMCVAASPGRDLVKLLVVGGILIGGNLTASRALSGSFAGTSRG